MALLTGLSEHPLSFAQLGDVVLLCNGHDANKIYDLRTGTAKTLGLSAPSAAPTSAEVGAGNVDGTVRYRVRWKDSSTGTYSLPSASLTVTCSAKEIRITAPGSPDSRATHWILERTVDNGEVYYPVNEYSLATNDGTAIATTTYDDDFADEDINARLVRYSNQGQPGLYKSCWVNGPTLFMGGGRVHKPTCNVTNGSANVSSSDGGFTSDMVGQDFSVDEDVTGVTYRILTVTDADNIVLAEAYAGESRGSAACRVAGVRNEVAFCVPHDPESWGESVVGGLDQVVRFPFNVRAGIGLGLTGCLICGANKMFSWRYRSSPKLYGLGGDGQIVPVRAHRGAFGQRSVFVWGEFIYGMDQYGIWRMTVEGEPVEIGQAIARDWRSLNMAYPDNFWIGADPVHRNLYFWVCESGDTYPSKAFVFNSDRHSWVGTHDSPHAGVPCGVSVPDSNLAERMLFFTEAVGSANAYAWIVGIGTTNGAPPTATKSGTIDGTPDSTSVTDSGAAWTTAGEGCDGVPVTVKRAADDSRETKVVVSNTATDLTTNAFTGTAPAVDDTYYLGPINSVWKTGRITFKEIKRKKYVRGLWLTLKHDTNAVDLNIRCYYDGSATAANYGVAYDENGVTHVADKPDVTIDPGALDAASEGINRYWVPLPAAWCNDIQLEFWSVASGEPWEIQACEIEYELDKAERVARD